MTQRDRIVLVVVAAVLALGGFWMLILKPKRQEASDFGQKLEQAQQRVETARASVTAGEAARTDYATNYATVARLGKAVPVDDDVPALVYQLDTTARESGVDFRTIKLASGAAAPQAPANAAQSAAATQDNSKNDSKDSSKDSSKESSPSSSSSSSSSSQPAGGATGTAASPAAPTQAATVGLPPGAIVGPAGLSTMPFSFTFEGSFFKLSDFLTRLERYIKAKRRDLDVRGRLLLIDGISLNAGPKGFPTMTASIAAQAYLLPADQGLYNGATPIGPSAVSASQPAESSGSSPPVAPATVAP